MAKVRITKKPKALSGLEVKMQDMKPGLYGTNGNRQFSLPNQIQSSRFSEPHTDVRSTLGPVDREDANLEAEKGETAVINVDGMPAHFKIGGKRHSEGGTPLSLPDNSFIYSDTSKMKIKDLVIQAQFGMVPKKSGYTPAEISKKYDINKFRKVLADKNSEPVERKTAEMMISNYNLKLAKLALIQESMKGFPQGIPLVAMPYIIENELDAAQFLPDQAQEQLEGAEQPDADTGEARYGANVVSQWDTHRYGGIPKAQEGMETNEEPGFWSKVGHGVLNVLEAPQKAMMYGITAAVGDTNYEMINPKTGQKEWIHEDNKEAFQKSGYVPTGEWDKAHYEMPGETLKRTYPQSSPVLQGALDIVADPLLVTGLAKTGARMAVKKITQEAADQVVKGTLKNQTIAKGVQSVLLNSGKKATVKNIKIAEKAIDAAQRSVDAGKTAKAFTAARKAGATELMKQDLKQTGKVAEKYLGKPIADAARATVKGAKYLGQKAKELAKNVDVPSLGPLGVPLIASAARNVSTLGLKEDLAKTKAENIRLKEAGKKSPQFLQKRVAEDGEGIFSNTSTPGAEYVMRNGQYIPYTGPVKKDSLLISKPKIAATDSTQKTPVIEQGDW